MQLSIYEIAKELQLESGTVRIWLDNFRFNSFRQKIKPVSYNVTKEMLNLLEEYLSKKKQTQKIKETIWHLKWLRARV